MNESGGLDLSGDWAGIYSYPQGLAPVAFTANVSEQSGWLSGAIEEESSNGLLPAQRRGASIQGRRIGLAVTWLKMYADREVHHDVDYEGVVSADGGEISGRWSIFGDWSGVFLMVRKPGLTEWRDRSASQRI